MTEAFNCHFANIGHDLARDIPAADTVPESYLISTNATLSFKSCSSIEVRKLLEKLETNKSTGLDDLPSRILKIAAGVLAPSLAQDVNNYRPISIIPGVVKVFEKIIYDQFFKYLNDNDLLAVNLGLYHFIAH